LHVLSERFEKPEGFDLVAHLEAEGVRPSQKNIELEFTQAVWPRARVGIPARIDEETHGTEVVRVSFRFDNLDYVAGWLLRFGADVHVLAPADLQNLVSERAGAIAALYR